MQCLRDYVGIKGCSYAPSLSGMYLNGLAGIEFANIDGIANADQLSWAGVWSDVQDRAVVNFRDDINNEFQKRYLIRQITQTVDLGLQYDTTVLTTPVGGTQYGIAIETSENYQNSIACSNLQSIYIQALNFYFYDNLQYPSITITILDADLNTQLYVTTIAGVQGWNNIWIDQQFSSRRILVLVSGNFTKYVNYNIANFNLNNFGGWTTAFGGAFGSGWGTGGSWLLFNWGKGCGCQSRINGVQYTGNPLSPTFGTNTFGLSAQFSIRCGFDNIVCANKKFFASAWQYCLAKEFLDELMWSSRTNRWTTIDMKKYEQLSVFYERAYRGGSYADKEAALTGIKVVRDYMGKLPQAVRSIVLNDFDCCLEKNDHFMSVETRM